MAQYNVADWFPISPVPKSKLKSFLVEMYGFTMITALLKFIIIAPCYSLDCRMQPELPFLL